MKYLKPSILFIFLILANFSIGQDALLAHDYYENSEFEKALSVYEKLLEKQPQNRQYFERSVSCYQQLERFSEAEEIITKKLKKYKSPDVYIEYGYNYQLQNDSINAKTNYTKALEMVDERPTYSYSVGNKFQKMSLLDYAIKTYEIASAKNEKLNFDYALGQIYGEQGKIEEMFDKYLTVIEHQPRYYQVTKRKISGFIDENPDNEYNSILKRALLTRLQESQNPFWNEELSWFFVQQNQLNKAFIQEKALYRRNPENLSRIIDLVAITEEQQDLELAKNMLNFIIENSTLNDDKVIAYQKLLKIDIKQSSAENYQVINDTYNNLLQEFGTDFNTLGLQIDYAHFLAFNFNSVDKSIEILKNALDYKIDKFSIARIKMKLADVLILNEKFNQALIYYSQIQTKLKNHVLSQEARFKVAKTSFYKGDFEWSSQQLEVLKKSTTQLIANDALDLFLVINDNQKDSLNLPLKKYAKAELKVYQEKKDDAIALFSEIITEFSEEKVKDDALYKQALLYEEKHDYINASENYLQIINFFADGIYTDNALYRISLIYADKLDKPTLAKEFLEKIIFNHQDSIHFVDARKKYRVLRGDDIN